MGRTSGEWDTRAVAAKTTAVIGWLDWYGKENLDGCQQRLFYTISSYFYIEVVLRGYKTFTSFISLDRDNFSYNSHNKHLINTHKRLVIMLYKKEKLI